MDWAKLGELSVGLAAAVLILWIVLVKAKSNGHGLSATELREQHKEKMALIAEEGRMLRHEIRAAVATLADRVVMEILKHR